MHMRAPDKSDFKRQFYINHHDCGVLASLHIAGCRRIEEYLREKIIDPVSSWPLFWPSCSLGLIEWGAREARAVYI